MVQGLGWNTFVWCSLRFLQQLDFLSRRLKKPSFSSLATRYFHSSVILRQDQKKSSPSRFIHQPVSKLLVYGDAELFRAQSVHKEEELKTPEFREKLDCLIGTLGFHDGLGLAAPQIGWRARVFAMTVPTSPAAKFDLSKAPPNGPKETRIWINPRVVQVSINQSYYWEGCLSIPNMVAWVARPRSVEVAGWDENGVENTMKLEGMAARVFQHELDHLDGTLMVHRVTHPRFILPWASLNVRDKWDTAWPSPGARKTPLGKLSFDPWKQERTNSS